MVKKNIPVIGIGASAGGLEPLETFFENIDEKAGFAYVVIQHLAPNHKSLMDELLARHTKLPISIIKQGTVIQPNAIYLNPPKKIVEIKENLISLNDKEENQLSFPISYFFQSLSEAKEDNCAAIILSGTGSDGSEGIKFVKEKGGLVLVQKPESARFDGMPKNAIYTGAVDKINEVADMPHDLALYFKHTKTLLEQSSSDNHNSSTIAEILQELYEQVGMDFSNYKSSTISRRITRRAGLLGILELDEYFQKIKNDKLEGEFLAKELLIGVTRFFRDHLVFDAIKDKVIPQLVENNRDSKQIRIWVPACSTGEEAYSLAILLKDYLKKNKLQYDVTIFATDLDKEAIKTAGNQVFPESIATEVNKETLNAYFIAQNKGYKIAKEIRDMIVFSAHNIIQDPPFSKIDILSCRNFLIYLNPEIQQSLFSMFQSSLKTDGFLILGSSEALGKSGENFHDYDLKNKIYLNKINRNLQIQNSLAEKLRVKLKDSAKLTDFTDNSEKVEKSQLEKIQHFLVQNYAPDSVAFNENFNLIHTTGSVNKWLKFPMGAISTNLIKMLPDPWQTTFELAANKAFLSSKTVILKNIEVPKPHVKNFLSKKVNIEIAVVNNSNEEKIALATFHKVTSVNKIVSPDAIELNMQSSDKLGLLEQELRVNKESLQSTIEELESSNEELQATNEELQSSNEELESVNEELYTVNAEFQEKVFELTDSNNDLNNLINSTNIAILFLDNDLNIRRFTPLIRDIFDILPQDIGRHISYFRSRFDLKEFTGIIEKVHETLVPYETLLNNVNGKHYAMKVTPFRTMKNEVTGIVLSFVDVSTLKSVTNQLQISQEALESLSDKFNQKSEVFELMATYATDLIALHNIKGDFEYISPSVEEILGYQANELTGKSFLSILLRDSDKKLIIKTFNDAFVQNYISNIQYQVTHKSGSVIWIESQVRPIYHKGAVVKILSNSRDITQRKNSEEELNMLSTVVRQTNNIVIITDKEERITFVNKAFETTTGYSEDEVLGKDPGKLLQGKESDPVTRRIMREAVDKKESFSVEIINYTKDNHKYWMQIYCEPMFNNHNELIGFFSLQNDNSEQKEYERFIEKLNHLLKNKNKSLLEVNNTLEEFAYVASHDLKEPVRNVKGMLELIKRKASDKLDEKTIEYIDVALRSSEKMNKLIESLLLYSRTGALAESPEEINIKAAVDDVTTALAHNIKSNKAEIVLNSKVKKVQVYPILFSRLLQNLISNAIKYRSEKNPYITITVVNKEEEYMFSISDNGIGIKQADYQNIFKIFHILNVKENSDSNGIGLSVCKKIVESHFGKITVESELGKGTTIHFTISKNL